MTLSLPRLLLPVLAVSAAASSEPVPDPRLVMERVAANVEATTEARRQYVYHQTVRSSLVRTNGQVSRKEKREYTVLPSEKGTEKRLVVFAGEYRKGKDLLPYTKPDFQYKEMDIDGELIEELTDELVDDKESHDGIPHSLFPLRAKDLPAYRFTMKGEANVQGRRAYHIAFEPQKRGNCIQVGGENESECSGQPWKGEAWIDAEEFQPVRIQTDLSYKVPWAVRVFLGTNLRQTGFSISYKRVAENVWFPSSYGTEFRLNALWFYKRTITLSLDSSQFQRTGAESTVAYELPESPK
jgi:hypothetical protein